MVHTRRAHPFNNPHLKQSPAPGCKEGQALSAGGGFELPGTPLLETCAWEETVVFTTCASQPIIRNLFIHMFIYYFSGETQANSQHILQGKLNSPLNANGITQCKKLGVFFAQNNLNFTHCFTSPLQRALQSAQHILDQSALYRPAIKTDERLLDRNLGIFENTPYSVIEQMANEQKVKAYELNYEGGESLKELQDRCSNFIEQILRDFQTNSGKEGFHYTFSHNGL